MHKLRLWWLVLSLALLATTLVAGGCGGDDGGGDSGGPFTTIEKGKLKVGSDIPYVPFEFGRAPNYKGFDIDLVNALAKRLNLQTEFIDAPFEPIFRNLDQGRFDMVASAAPITEERRKTVDFSDPYFVAEQSLMVKKGSDVQRLDQVGNRVLGAQRGTTGADYAKSERLDAKAVRTYEAIDDAFKALRAGQIEVLMNDYAVSKYAERKYKDLQVVAEISTEELYGLAFNKDSKALRNAVNTELQKIKADGTYTGIYRKWFRSDPPDQIFNIPDQAPSPNVHEE